MDTYIVLARLLLQCSLAIGWLVALCMAVALARRASSIFESDTSAETAASLTGCVARWFGALLGLLLHLWSARLLWQAARQAQILACAPGPGCLSQTASLEGEPFVFWFSAALYWSLGVAAAVLYLSPPLRMLQTFRSARQRIRAEERDFAATEPLGRG